MFESNGHNWLVLKLSSMYPSFSFGSSPADRPGSFRPPRVPSSGIWDTSWSSRTPTATNLGPRGYNPGARVLHHQQQKKRRHRPPLVVGCQKGLWVKQLQNKQNLFSLFFFPPSGSSVSSSFCIISAQDERYVFIWKNVFVIVCTCVTMSA